MVGEFALQKPKTVFNPNAAIFYIKKYGYFAFMVENLKPKNARKFQADILDVLLIKYP